MTSVLNIQYLQGIDSLHVSDRSDDVGFNYERVLRIEGDINFNTKQHKIVIETINSVNQDSLYRLERKVSELDVTDQTFQLLLETEAIRLEKDRVCLVNRDERQEVTSNYTGYKFVLVCKDPVTGKAELQVHLFKEYVS